MADPNANSGTGSTNNTAFSFKDLSGIKAVVINEGITSIGDRTFLTSPNLQEFTSVSIPSTVTSIGESAFNSCANLQTVNFADGSQLQSIGNDGFEDTGIESLVLPCPNLSSIGMAAFDMTTFGQKLSEIVCLTETSLSVNSDVFYNWFDRVTVYMHGSHKVNWSRAKAVKGLVSSVVKGDGVSTMTIDDSGAETKTVNGTTYYVGGTTVTLTLASNLSGTVSYWANGQALPVSNGQATLTIPNDASTVTVTATQVELLTQGTGTHDDPYRISSVSDWNTFAGMINAGIDADKYYLLTNDIGTEQEPVTTMVGTMTTPFRGTFGYSPTISPRTITVAISSTTDNCAPFVCLDGADIWYLTVRGTITTSAKYAASIAAHNKGTSYIRYCESYATIESTVATASDGTHGGFVAVNESDGVLVFEESIFKGKLLGSNATSSGGFVGYNSGEAIDYQKCLFAPTEVTMSATGSATFNRNGKATFHDDKPSYYTQSFGVAQGTLVYAFTDDFPASCTYTTVKAVDDQTYYQVTGMTIGSTADWTAFAEAVNGGMSFAGLTVKLAEAFDNTSNPVTTMAGTSTNKFSGTFDGQGRTLNVALTSEGEYTAPFRYVNGGTFKNLRTAGTVTTSHKYATGLIGSQAGNTTIQNCHSGVTIISSVNGDGTHGGFIGTGGGTFQGCVFNGVICTTTEYTDTPTGTNSCGGFVGWNSASVSISNSLYAPAAIPEGKYRIGSTSCATFARNGATVTNSYYTEALGTAQGTQARSITAGENVTVANAGDATATYTVSGITVYGTSLKYGSNIYAASGDVVSLTLSNTPPTGYTFSSYTASSGTLSGDANPYTLTMPDEDVTVTATLKKLLTHTDITISIPSQEWTGSILSPIVTMKDGETTLTEGTDYTVTAPDGSIQNTGDYTYTINGAGNYAGSTTAKFTIEPRETYQFGAAHIVEDQNGTTAIFDGMGSTSTDPIGIAPQLGITVNHVKYDRTFTSGKASTMMLPFDYTCTGNEGGTFYKFIGVEKENEQWVATMKATDDDANNVGTLTKNTPYLFMPTAEAMTFTIPNGGVTLCTEGGGNCETADEGSHWTFKGTYSYIEWTAGTTDPNYTSYADEIGRTYGFAGVAKDGINVGDFVKVKSGAKIRPMCCYLLWNDAPNNARALTRGAAADDTELPQRITVKLIDANGVVTSIGEIETTTGEVSFDGWYDMNGRRLDGKPSTKGIYINNGRKIVIK